MSGNIWLSPNTPVKSLPMNAWLETESGVRIPLHAVCSIGRSAKNTIVLNDERVSRRHALVHCQGGTERWLVDLGSSNGVLLNGKRITQPTALKDRDQFEIVDKFFTIRLEEAAPGEDATEQTLFITKSAVQPAPHWLLTVELDPLPRSGKPTSDVELSQKVGGWFSETKEIVEKNKGTVNRFWAEGFLTFWAAADTSAETVANVLLALKHLQETSPLPFRWGAHYGLVAMDPAALAAGGTISGREVTFVVRMDKLARSLKLPNLLSEAAATELKGFVPTMPAGEHSAGKQEAAHHYFSV